MYALPILPDEMRVPLDEAGLAGVVAVLRPLDVEEQAKWNDAFPGQKERNTAAVALVRQQLLRLEGLEFVQGDQRVSYDRDNPLHFRSLPTDAVAEMYGRLIARSVVPEVLEKNSDSPSVSGGTSGGDATPAETAAEAPATS